MKLITMLVCAILGLTFLVGCATKNKTHSVTIETKIDGTVIRTETLNEISVLK